MKNQGTFEELKQLKADFMFNKENENEDFKQEITESTPLKVYIYHISIITEVISSPLSRHLILITNMSTCVTKNCHIINIHVGVRPKQTWPYTTVKCSLILEVFPICM